MITIKVQGKDLTLPTSWNEINMETIVPIMDLQKKYEDGYEIEYYLMELFAILTNTDVDFFYDSYITDEEVQLIGNSLTEFMEPISFTKADCFKIDGKLYSYNNFNKLTYGEDISYKLLNKNSKSDFESWLNLLSILIRPATETTDEFGEVKYVLDKFDGDVDILNKRKELIKKIPAVNGLYIVQSFTNGKNQ